MRIPADEGISLSIGAKDAGPRDPHRSVQMDFRYSTAFGAEPHESYERLLHDALLGDSTLFARRERGGGRLAIIDARGRRVAVRSAAEFPQLRGGTWNPEEAVELLTRDRRWWRKL